GQGLSGFINQVIRTGTNPGFVNSDLGIGGPAFYHKANFEFGGATPDRNFSYYVGLGGYNQDFRYVDQGNGQSVAKYVGQLGVPLGGNLDGTNTDPKTALGQYCLDPVRASSYFSCYQNGTTAPAGYSQTSTEFGSTSTLNERDSVVNLHFGLPHKSDGSKDDVQILYLNNFLRTQFFSSGGDLTNVATQSPTQTLNYIDGYAFNLRPGQALPTNYQALTSTYYAASSSQERAKNSAIPIDNRDSYQNNQSIFKLQYQKNFSSQAYLRLYGYLNYSNWLINGQNAATFGNFNIGGQSADYELSSHTQGLSATFADQINSKNLLSLQGSFTTSSTLRDNNRQNATSSGSRSRFATVVDSSDPTNGLCYKVSADATGAPASSKATVCSPAAGVSVRATYATLPQAAAGTIPFANNIGTINCGGGPCQYYVVENGQQATYNTVRPRFYGLSLTDTFKPSDKLLINAGIRYDSYGFQGSDTTATPARTLFYNAFNRDNCTDGNNGLFSKTSLGVKVTDPCPQGYSVPGLVNASAQQQQYPVFQPRLGATYTLTPDTVLRASYGRYAQAPNTAFEQYNYLQQNSPASLGTSFYKYGFRTPSHNVKPEVSNNYDFSLEHHFKGTDLSFKLTPFYRYTQDQIQTFFLDQPTNFVSGLNADRLTARGVEFQFNKGDFGRNGFAGQLSFTYTNAYAQYNKFAGGSSVFDGINNDIQAYNGFTKACATAGNKACPGAAASTNAVPCFGPDGTPDPTCATGSIANPYFNAPAQGLVDTNGKFAPFSLVTGPIGASATSYLVPYAGTVILNYKKDKFAITPSVQINGGQRYGVPESTSGIDPSSGCAALGGSTVKDPRYPYGAAGGAPYDAATCAATLNAIPNPFTKRFDGIGDFVNPTQLVANMQLSYEASKNVTFVATMANIVNTCFGGTKNGFTTGGSDVCSYGLISGGNFAPYYGNVFNPTSVVDPVIQSPYQRSYGNLNATKNLFSIFVDAKIKL
ncbi:MAG: TonB-dependent receptor, partial [Candidatus Eremiobacteraeota bacterium]|nr:TonB-dependent receptor [Candidatus Eremiobacteraeota bacterium]